MATTLTAQNTYCHPVRIQKGFFGIQISGTWAGTLTLQWNNGGTWTDETTFTSNTLQTALEPSGRSWRLGFKTGEYTSGSAVLDITQ